MSGAPSATHQFHRRRRSRARRWVIAGASVVTLGLIAWPLMTYYEIPPFTDKGEAISFGQNDGKGGQQKADSKALMPLGPHADFKISGTVPEDGSKIAVITYQREKSHFKGKVWVWAPKQYYDPKYKDKGFPVMIALPGGAGFPNNYWMGTNLKLQASVQKLADEGKSLPFIIAMPVLNPENHDKDKHDPVLGRYWDGSDIPGQPKMGTWLTEDVPQLIKENFRTIKSRDGWAFMGSSTGGFAGLKAVVKYPDKFKAVIASGPDIVPDSQLWNPYPKEKAANNPEVLSKQLIAKGGPDVYLAFQYGTLEGSVKSKVDKYIATYGNKGPIHSHLQVIQGGEHDAKDYVKGMNESSLEWISQRMQGPVA